MADIYISIPVESQHLDDLIALLRTNGYIGAIVSEARTSSDESGASSIEKWIEAQPRDFQRRFWEIFHSGDFTALGLHKLLMSYSGDNSETLSYSVADVIELINTYYKTGVVQDGAQHLFDDNAAKEDTSKNNDGDGASSVHLLPLERWMASQPGYVQTAFWDTVHKSQDGRRKIHASLQSLSDAGVTTTPYPFSSDEAVRSLLRKFRGET